MDISLFGQRLETMFQRLEHLYAQAENSHVILPDVSTTVWKELGVASEELQVAHEELSQQNEHLNEALLSTTMQSSYYQNLIAHIPEAYLVTTAEGKIQEASSRAASLFRLSHANLIGKLLISFVVPDHRIAFRTQLCRLSQQETRSQPWATWFQPRDSAPLHLFLTTSAAINPETQQVNLHWILRETAETWSALPLTHSNGSSNGTSQDSWLNDRPVVTYSKGETIPLSPQTLWLVKQGLVKLHTLTQENEEVLLGLLGALSPFGAGSPSLLIYQATALTDVQLLQFSLAEVKASCEITQWLLAKLNQRLHQVEALLTIAGQRRVKHRLCLLLQLLQQEIGEPNANGTRLSLRLTHGDLANACCTTRVTITRLLGELQRQGKLKIDSQFHIVLNS